MINRIDRDIAEAMRDEITMREKILRQLNDHPQTIPEIADAVGYSGHDVMFWLMSMWRYGWIEETGKPNDEGYYKYRALK